MIFINKNVFRILLLFLLIGLLSCNKYEEPVPFSDGLFLEYDAAGIKTIFSFERQLNLNYKITETEKRKPLNDKIIDIFVDSYGKVYKSSFKDYEGGFSPIWIPIHVMKVGDIYDGGYKLTKKDRWKKWDVMVIENPAHDEEQYFDVNTGYLVGVKGRFGMSYEVVLVNTNADIPNIEE